MIAFVLHDRRVGVVSDRPRPQPEHGLVRVRMIRAGICNTDLELARGYMSFEGVLGHEFVGEALDGRFAHKRVVGGINFGCMNCPRCARNETRHCPNRRVLGIVGADGSMAEEFVIPERNLVVVPDDMPDDVAVFAEPVAAACQILEQLGETFERCSVLVIGAGKLGLLVAEVLASDGFEVTLVARSGADRLTWVKDRGVQIVNEVPRSRRYGVVVDATGSNEGLALAVEATEPGGTLVLKTTVAGEHQVNLAPLVINEISVIGSRCGRIEAGLAALAAGRVDPIPLIDASYPLSQAEDGFAQAGTRGARKVLLRGS